MTIGTERPILESARLLVRPFVPEDLADVYRLLDVELGAAELGLFYAVSPAHQRQGYATEVAKALVDYAFQQLRLKRVVATTSYDNAASQDVMHKLGLSIERNPSPEPPWLQVVGVLEAP